MECSSGRPSARQARALALFAVGLALATSCVVKEIPAPAGPGSFEVEVVSIDALPARPECQSAPALGSMACLRPFPDLDSPVTLTLHAQALDRKGEPLAWNGSALIDVRPGRLVGVGPAGLSMGFVDGEATIDLSIAYAFGGTRIWVEDCGTGGEAGSYATGVSDPIWFESPTLAQINATTDNTTSPLTPKADNVCAIIGDPRYGVGRDRDTGEAVFVGYSHGGTVNAPPAPVGNFLEIRGCTRQEYDEGICTHGPLIVTAIGNEGFYVTDISQAAMEQGFNHMYAFNFNYPENLEVGDMVTLLRGSPVEFAGSTQLSNPVWRRDSRRAGHDLLPMPVHILPDEYSDAVRTYGRNREEIMTLEKLEGALVCMDNLAPASQSRDCDANQSGDIERQGCLTEGTLPQLCSVAMDQAPMPPNCDADSIRPYCLPMTEQEVEQCKLSKYIPANPLEYCCERICYDSLECTERSSYDIYGQWTADIYGRYESNNDPVVKVAVITRDAQPDFDPLQFGIEQRGKPAGARERVRVIGNLRQVLAARPVWVIVARSPSDIEVGGSCP